MLVKLDPSSQIVHPSSSPANPAVHPQNMKSILKQILRQCGFVFSLPYRPKTWFFLKRYHARKKRISSSPRTKHFFTFYEGMHLLTFSDLFFLVKNKCFLKKKKNLKKQIFFFNQNIFCFPPKVTKFCSKKNQLCKKKRNCFWEKTFFRKFFGKWKIFHQILRRGHLLGAHLFASFGYLHFSLRFFPILQNRWNTYTHSANFFFMWRQTFFAKGTYQAICFNFLIQKINKVEKILVFLLCQFFLIFLIFLILFLKW